MGAPHPITEDERIEALTSYRILDTAAEGEFDHYARMVAQLCGTQIGAMTLIDRDRQWVKAVHGPLARSIPRDHSFCPHTLLQRDVLEVPDASLDARFSHSALVTQAPFVRFYAGVALVARNGAALGTLCVFDVRPGRLNAVQKRVMVLAAAHIAAQLELRRAVLQLVAEKKLGAECRLALSDSQRRQQELTQMLVHDLKGPLTTVALNAQWLADEKTLTPPEQAAAEEIVEAGQVLEAMVNDVLDVSCAEDGQLLVRREPSHDLGKTAQTCVEGSRKIAAYRRQTVELVVRNGPPLVDSDPKLLARVIGNLLDNAYKYAPAESRIEVSVMRQGRFVELRVTDEGAGIPREQREAVFQKYFKIDDTACARTSHGLGLAFCRLAVEALDGTLAVEEKASGCVFLLTLPASTAQP